MVKLIAWLTNIVLVIQSMLFVNVNDVFSDVKNVYLDLSYGKSDMQKVDLYIPEDANTSEGLILFIHGGSWDHGSKEGFAKKCEKYAGKGYVTAAVNYRLITQGACANDMINDISSALKKVKQVALKRNVKIDKVMLVGISAGAHLALLYGYTRSEVAPMTPTAVVAYCPPSDLYDDKMYTDTGIGNCNHMVNTMSTLCGEKFTFETKVNSKAALMAISPYYNVDSDCIPTLFCHGKFDGAVPYAQSVRLKMKLDSYEVPNNFVIFPNSSHSLADDPDKTKLFNSYFEEYLFAYLN